MSKPSVLLLGSAGYIGTVLGKFLVEEGYNVTAVDLEWFGNVSSLQTYRVDYNKLTRSFLRSHEIVILLAGHASIQSCAADKLSSFRNNVVNFVELLEKLDTQKFIYASSSSLYNGMEGKLGKEDENIFIPTGAYDIQKKEIDYYATISNLNYYGLRFATVNGFSLHLRNDVMINKMVFDSIRNHKIEVYNPGRRRPILGINDLCRAFLAIIQKEDSIPGIYNLASFNSSVGVIANRVAEITKVPVEIVGETPSMDFLVSTEKFINAFNFKFVETTESIARDVLDNLDKAQVITKRDKGILYV